MRGKSNKNERCSNEYKKNMLSSDNRPVFRKVSLLTLLAVALLVSPMVAYGATVTWHGMTIPNRILPGTKFITVRPAAAIPTLRMWVISPSIQL